jgi:hypothetical protein
MPNILILVALLTYAWPYLDARRVFSVGVVAVVVAQCAVSTVSGFSSAAKWDTQQTTAGRLVVNLRAIPATEQGCYNLYGSFVYLIFVPGTEHYIGFAQARQDHLNAFAPGTVGPLARAGLPILSQCRPK